MTSRPIFMLDRRRLIVIDSGRTAGPWGIPMAWCLLADSGSPFAVDPVPLNRMVPR